MFCTCLSVCLSLLARLAYSTSSSAVTKRPRDASCLSVVSFNSTKRRVVYFILSYVGYRFVTVCVKPRNVKASCHKHFVVFSRNQHRRLLPAMCHNLRDGSRCSPATAFTTHSLLALTQAVKPDIGSESRFLPITPPAFDAPVMSVPVGILLRRLAWKK